MKLRITSGPRKVSFVIVACIVILIVGLGVMAAAGPLQAVVVMDVLEIAFLFLAVRTFRGDSEAVTEPRAWWRMSERPTGGFIVAGYFAIQAVAIATKPIPGIEITSVAAALTTGLISLAFLHSSIRLLRDPQ